MRRVGENTNIEGEYIVMETFEIGKNSLIRKYAKIEGRFVILGDNAYMDDYSLIGGGSCFDALSRLEAGNHLHMGRFSIINTARRVTIGDEVGIGIGTRIFTHGAYLSALDGFPYKFAPVVIGSHVWLPNAIVNPGVTIGDNVVVLPNSVVTKDLPSGCLAGGSPAKVIEKNAYPKKLDQSEKLEIVAEIVATGKKDLKNQFRRYGIRC